MGEAFHDAWPEMRERFARLDAAYDGDLQELCFETPAERLRHTEHTQPAVYAVGVSAAGAVAERYDPEVTLVTGHSLGHVTAAAHAELFDAVDGLTLVTARGRAMERAARADGPGRMVAVLTADPAVVTEACDAVEGASVAAYNTARQTVVSGRCEAVEPVCDRIGREDGARFLELDVSAAFHSPVVAGAVGPVTEAVESTPTRPARLPVVSDVTGERYTSPAVCTRDLVDQVLSPVDWRAVVGTLDAAGVDRCVELPPAGTLADFAERTTDATVSTLDDPADARAVFGS
jgi:[acyl-carrier-protein] S-malonyltransferase